MNVGLTSLAAAVLVGGGALTGAALALPGGTSPSSPSSHSAATKVIVQSERRDFAPKAVAGLPPGLLAARAGGATGRDPNECAPKSDNDLAG